MVELMGNNSIYNEEPDCYELWIIDEDLVTEEQAEQCLYYHNKLYVFVGGEDKTE